MLSDSSVRTCTRKQTTKMKIKGKVGRLIDYSSPTSCGEICLHLHSTPFTIAALFVMFERVTKSLRRDTTLPDVNTVKKKRKNLTLRRKASTLHIPPLISTLVDSFPTQVLSFELYNICGGAIVYQPPIFTLNFHLSCLLRRTSPNT